MHMPAVLGDRPDAHLYHLRVHKFDEKCRYCIHARLTGTDGLEGVKAFAVVREDGTPVLETDDWVAVQEAALTGHWPRNSMLTVIGTHPTHEWGPPHEGQSDRWPRCTKCDAWDNTSYGSQAPCGYDFRGRALITVIEDELAAR